MPIYEYQCSNCHHHFDLMQKVNDDPVKQCPKCFQNAVERLVSAAGFQLKGSGWYVTDFRDKGKPAAKSAESSQSTTSTEKTAGSDSKSSTEKSKESKD